LLVIVCSAIGVVVGVVTVGIVVATALITSCVVIGLLLVITLGMYLLKYPHYFTVLILGLILIMLC
jgi:hypothetical protein